MPIVGVLCGMDGTCQSFDTCVHAHETMSAERNCHVPVASIKSQRDNIKYRKNAGFSASVLLSCPRAYAIEQTHDLYESVMSGYNKFRGTLIHALFEADPDPPAHVIQERRLYRWVTVRGKRVRVTGKPDYVDPVAKLLIDFKSKHNLPLKLDPMHEAQFNIYRWLLADGFFMDTNMPCQIEIDRIGAHYITFNTKPDKAWKKVLYPVWDLEYAEQVVIDRLAPLIEWQDTGVLPEHRPFEVNKFWTCDCERYEAQLADRGIEL